MTMKKMDLSPFSIGIIFLFLMLFALHMQGFCDASAELEAQAQTVMNKVFSKPIRMIVLLFGIAWGFIKSYAASSFQPMILYGGLGFALFLLPKLIEFLSSLS